MEVTTYQLDERLHKLSEEVHDIARRLDEIERNMRRGLGFELEQKLRTVEDMEKKLSEVIQKVEVIEKNLRQF